MTTGGYLDDMKAVGIKVLKAKLSEYLRQVKAGETILITERDEVIAEIRPPRRQQIGETSFEERLSAMAQRGEVTLRSKDPRKNWSDFLKGFPGVKDVDLGRLLDDLREESGFPGISR